MVLEAVWAGRVPYTDAARRMSALADACRRGECGDTLLLLEHDHVYTLGRRATTADILLDAETLSQRGIAVADTDRGGLVTYHGPGQLVGYPILDLGPSASPPAYVATLERALIATLARHGIEARVMEGLRGVWVDDAKIAAIGVHVSNGITTHGFALNVDPDLSLFAGIVPCGISDKRVTSIRELAGKAPAVADVASIAAEELAAALGAELRHADPAGLAETADA